MAERKRKQAMAVEPEVVSTMSREELATAIGARLAGARKGSKYTQAAIGEKMGVVPAYVSMIELGQRLPSVEVLASWANACGVPVAEFFTGLEEEVEAKR